MLGAAQKFFLTNSCTISGIGAILKKTRQTLTKYEVMETMMKEQVNKITNLIRQMVFDSL